MFLLNLLRKIKKCGSNNLIISNFIIRLMSDLQINYFINNLKEFRNDLLAIFPNLKDRLNKNYNDELLENRNSIEFVREFIIANLPYLDKISTCDETLFQNDKIYLLKGINFKKIWNKDLLEKNRKNIWIYLNTLYMRGNLILSNSGEIDEILSVYFENEDTVSYNDKISNLVKNLKTLKNTTDKPVTKKPPSTKKSDIVLGSLIEDVAKSVGDTLTSNNMSPEDIMTGLLSGKPNKELKNMMEGIATNVEQNLKSKNISENDLLGSLQNLMGSLPPEMMNLNKTMNNINKKN